MRDEAAETVLVVADCADLHDAEFKGSSHEGSSGDLRCHLEIRQKPVLSQDRFMDAVYGDQLDGGPERFGTLSIHLMRLRARIEPAGYTITKSMGRPRQGWRLVKLNVRTGEHKVSRVLLERANPTS